MVCDVDHDYHPPCPNNIVDALQSVLKVLGVPESDYDRLDIYWSDAWSKPSPYLYYTCKWMGLLYV